MVRIFVRARAHYPKHFLLYIAEQLCYTLRGAVAQRLEQRTHNPLVVGSNPTGPIAKGCIPEIEGMQPFSVYALIFNELRSP